MPPANDDFADAEVITGATGTVSGSNVGATFEVGEPPANDGFEGDDGDKTIWYRWTAPDSGNVTIDTAGSAFDTVLHVYTGAALGGLTLAAANDDALAPQSQVVFFANSGATYHVRVNGFSPAEFGAVTLNWALTVIPAFEVIVVDVTGTPFGTVENARPTRVAWELDGAGSAEITLATTDPDAALLLPGREVQVYYQGDLVWWGPIVRPQAGLNESTWQCQGLLWYFQHRFMGRADRVNLLTNGGFESSETGWTFSGVTHSVNTDMAYVLAGTKSEKLTGIAADHTTYATQTYTHVTQYHPDGDAVTVAAWVWVPSGDYSGGAFEDRGLFVIRRNSGGTTISAVAAEIGDDTPKDEWVQLEAVIPGVQATDTVEVRLYPPHGVAYWDEISATLMESLVFGNTDVADVMGGIVDYAQDNGPFTHGKSDLNIGTDTTPGTGVTVTRVYQFSEHRNIADAVQELVGVVEGGADFDFVLTPTTRTFTVYGGGKGSLYGTTLELDVNVADFTWSWDGEAAATSIVVLGPGDGPDRPEGGAVDPAALGGLTLEAVETAPDDATIGQLDTIAAEILATAKNPEILSVTTLPGAGVIGNLLVGDTVNVLVNHGWIDINAVYRVGRIEADMVQDQATITLNVTA